MIGLFEIGVLEKYVMSVPDENGNETNSDYNIQLVKHADNILRRGWKTWNGNGYINARVKTLTVNEFLLVMKFNGYVKYFNPYIKIAETNINNNVPTSLPNATYTETVTDPETGKNTNTIINRTWKTWRDVNHPLSDPIEEYYYFISASYGISLSGNDLLTIYNSDDATLVDMIPENNSQFFY
jgi:hypothetical protein